ncbi:hypothetical protein OXYTRIMIC_313 [Oxytricha trifallax]|uniref:Uncharacterized protein n=1 Tax=Oxytricha trifallax TaxID=1172189 RepID=A0A073HYF0_9SPIT|nr:hypothetical protein OXYTRIMIC_313 [Oxytricha trifallax]
MSDVNNFLIQQELLQDKWEVLDFEDLLVSYSKKLIPKKERMMKKRDAKTRNNKRKGRGFSSMLRQQKNLQDFVSSSLITQLCSHPEPILEGSHIALGKRQAMTNLQLNIWMERLLVALRLMEHQQSYVLNGDEVKASSSKVASILVESLPDQLLRFMDIERQQANQLNVEFIGKSNISQIMASQTFLLEDENSKDIVYDTGLRVQYQQGKAAAKNSTFAAYYKKSTNDEKPQSLLGDEKQKLHQELSIPSCHCLQREALRWTPPSWR